MKMSNKIYDFVRFAAEILLPALATLYAALAGIWQFPLSQEIIGTVAAVDAFLGAFVAFAREGYKKADVEE